MIKIQYLTLYPSEFQTLRETNSKQPSRPFVVKSVRQVNEQFYINQDPNPVQLTTTLFKGSKLWWKTRRGIVFGADPIALRMDTLPASDYEKRKGQSFYQGLPESTLVIYAKEAGVVLTKVLNVSLTLGIECSGGITLQSVTGVSSTNPYWSLNIIRGNSFRSIDGVTVAYLS